PPTGGRGTPGTPPPPGRVVSAAALDPQIGASRRVVKDHANRVAAPRPHAADAMSQGHSIDAAGTLHGTVLDGEDHAIASAERHHLHPRLHARPLLGQHELTAG